MRTPKEFSIAESGLRKTIRKFADFFNTYQLETAEKQRLCHPSYSHYLARETDAAGASLKIVLAGSQEVSSFSEFFAYVAIRGQAGVERTKNTRPKNMCTYSRTFAVELNCGLHGK